MNFLLPPSFHSFTLIPRVCVLQIGLPPRCPCPQMSSISLLGADVADFSSHQEQEKHARCAWCTWCRRPRGYACQTAGRWSRWHSYSPFSACEYLPVTPDTRTGSGSRFKMASVWARCGHGNSGSCIHMLTLQERLGPVRTSCHHHAGRKKKSPALRCATNHCCTRKLVFGWTSCRSLACAWDVPKLAPPCPEGMLSPSSRGGAFQNVFSPASMKQTRPESSKWHPTT